MYLNFIENFVLAVTAEHNLPVPAMTVDTVRRLVGLSPGACVDDRPCDLVITVVDQVRE